MKQENFNCNISMHAFKRPIIVNFDSTTSLTQTEVIFYIILRELVLETDYH